LEARSYNGSEEEYFVDSIKVGGRPEEWAKQMLGIAKDAVKTFFVF